MDSTSIRIGAKTHEALRSLAGQLDTTVENTITIAVRTLRQELMGRQLASTALRADEAAWLDADLG